MAAIVDLVTAFAFYKVLRRPDWMPDRPGAIRSFIMQLVLNALWPLAFAVHAPGIALSLFLALLATIALTGRRFGRIDRGAGLWVVVCGAWVAFLALVTLSIVIRN